MKHLVSPSAGFMAVRSFRGESPAWRKRAAMTYLYASETMYTDLGAENRAECHTRLHTFPCSGAAALSPTCALVVRHQRAGCSQRHNAIITT